MYKRYERYKDSGIEWIGEIPEHWDVTKLKRLAILSYGESLSAENRVSGSVPVYGSGGVIGFHNNANTSNPVIIIGRKGSYGSVFYSKHPVFVIDTAYFINAQSCSVSLKWLHYLIPLLELDKLSQDTGVPGLSRSYAYEKIIPSTSIFEQDLIANFLDNKTSEIDSLIADKEELIKRLEEYKQSIITEAVTKGLNPDVKMKDSGIKWIGEIPEHWEVKKVSWLFGLISSGATPESSNLNYYSDGNIPWLNTGELNDGFIYETKKHITEIAVREYSALKIYPPNVLVMAMYGATIGKLAITKISLSANQACCVLSKQKGIDIEFMFYWLLAKRKQIISMSYGGGQPNISQTLISSLRVGVPEQSEQREIVKHIRYKTNEADRLIRYANKHIHLLKSYRQSLIYEAVTGKIDVREYEPERSEQLA